MDAMKAAKYIKTRNYGRFNITKNKRSNRTATR
jgi:hypothetical protein